MESERVFLWLNIHSDLVEDIPTSPAYIEINALKPLGDHQTTCVVGWQVPQRISLIMTQPTGDCDFEGAIGQGWFGLESQIVIVVVVVVAVFVYISFFPRLNW